MSITRRILDGAQSGFSKLTSLVIVDDEPLSHVESEALKKELAARRAAKAASPRAPGANPVAAMAMATPAARAQREQLAAERRRRLGQQRDDRVARAKAAGDEAYRRLKEQAARGGATSSSSTSSSSSSGRRPGKSGGGTQVAEWSKTLDVRPGAELAEIKSAYRKLMRKYHPDMHAGNPSKLKAATELSVRVSAAYEGLIAHLAK